MEKKIFGRCKFLKDWPEWDDAAHEGDAQISRQGRAMTYKYDGDILIDEDKQIARFPSTSDLPYYDTTLSTCNCYDFQERHLPCKHMYRLAVELRIIEIVNRPRHQEALTKAHLDEIKNSGDIDSAPDQIKRQISARKLTPISLDKESKTAVFPSSGKVPYQTTLDTCTCRDFILRRGLPCKHIYRLRMALGLMS